MEHEEASGVAVLDLGLNKPEGKKLKQGEKSEVGRGEKKTDVINNSITNILSIPSISKS